VFAGITERPYVLFGHSLGSRVAFEGDAAVSAQRHSAAGAFHCLGKQGATFTQAETPIHDLRTQQFVEALRELDGTPEEILNNSELLQWLLPLLRADFRIADRISHPGGRSTVR